jgi:hypothetical protein
MRFEITKGEYPRFDLGVLDDLPEVIVHEFKECHAQVDCGDYQQRDA